MVGVQTMNPEVSDLQKAWDRFLIQSFYEYPYDSIQHVAQVFISKNGLAYEQFNALKRIPRNFHHQRVTAVRFVCAFLPKIAETLWKHNISQLEALAAAVSKLSSDAREIAVDEDKRKAEGNELRRSKDQAKRAYEKKQAFSDRFEKHRRSAQWGVTK